MKLSFPKVLLLFSVGLMSLYGCKKTDLNLSGSNDVGPAVQYLQTTKIEKMRKFLSITLNVATDKVVYNPVLKEFSVLNTLKFDYASLEARYDAANEYKLNYE